MNTQDKLFGLQLEEYFKEHLRNLNDDLIDQFRILIENDFMKKYWYKSTEDFNWDLLVEKTSEEVWEITTFWILRKLDVEKQKKITDLLIAKKNVKELLEKPNCLIDMHGIEYWAWVVERKRKEVRELF